MFGFFPLDFSQNGKPKLVEHLITEIPLSEPEGEEKMNMKHVKKTTVCLNQGFLGNFNYEM